MIGHFNLELEVHYYIEIKICLLANNAKVCCVPSSVGVLTNLREVSLSHQCPLRHHGGPSIFYILCLRNGAVLLPELRFTWSAGASPSCHKVKSSVTPWTSSQLITRATERLTKTNNHWHSQTHPLRIESFLFTSNACFCTVGGCWRTQRKRRENPCRHRKNLQTPHRKASGAESHSGASRKNFCRVHW